MEAQLPALPNDFRKTALAFPSRVKTAIAKIGNIGEAADGLAQADVVANYAKRIKATGVVVNSVQYGKLLLAAKVGELCPAEQGKRSDLTSSGTPTRLDIHRETLANYRKLARHQTDGRIDDYWEAVTEADHEAEMSIAGFLNFVGSGGVIATRHGGGVIEWYTPKDDIERVRKVLGTIELDPATSDAAQKIVKAKIHYTKEDDGLARPWQGKVFLNPPFKTPLVSQFVNKLCDEHEAGRVTEAILLTNDNTDTGWWQRAAETARALCFNRGRISFYNEAGESSSPTNGQTFFYLGNSEQPFLEIFSDRGVCRCK